MDVRRYGHAVYRSPRWQALRLQAKRRDGWKCLKCGARSRLEVDHIVPIREAPERAFDLDNLQTLCPVHHGRKTRIEVGIAPLDPKRQQWRDFLNQKELSTCLSP